MAEITEDDFEAWREHPITRWVFAAIEQASDAQREQWMSLSWDRGSVDPVTLCELRTRADAYRALSETTFQRWVELHESSDT